MRLSSEDLNLKVVVRRICIGSAPFAWELHHGETSIPLGSSPERFKSMEAAYQAGHVGLKAYLASLRSTHPGQSKPDRMKNARLLSDISDEDDTAEASDDEEEFTEMDLLDQPSHIAEQVFTSD